MPLHARFSSLLSNSAFTLSNGNLTATAAAGQSRIAMADVGRASGKWYFEFTLDTQMASGFCSAGILRQEHEWANKYVGHDTTFDGIGYYIQQAAGESTYRDNVSNATGALTVTQGDVIGVAVNLDNGKFWFSVNGAWLDSGNPGGDTGERYSGLSGTYLPAVSARSGEQWTANFGEQPFAHTVPAGFNAGWYAEETSLFITDDAKDTDQNLAFIEDDGRSVRWALGNPNSYGSSAIRGNALIDAHYNAGKWYWEMDVEAGTLAQLGFCNASYDLGSNPSTNANCWVASQVGGAFFCAGVSSGSLTFGIGDRLGFAVDMGAGTVTVYKNDVALLTDICSLSGTLYPIAYGNVSAGGASEISAAWASADFTYTPPADYIGPGDFDPQFTWDSTEKGAGITLRALDSIAENTTDDHNVFATCGPISSGKWYWEIICTSGIEDVRIGLAEASYSHTTALGASSESCAVLTLNGNKQKNAESASAYCAGGNIDNYDVVSVALDMDNGRVFFGVDGTWCDSGDPVAGTDAAFTGITIPMVPAISGSEDVGSGNSYARLVSHPSLMAYEPPTGFRHLDEYTPPVSGDGDVDLELELDATGRVTIHGDGAPDIDLEIDATGDIKTRHGDGAPDIELEIDGVGRITIHGDATVDVDLSLVSAGTITRSGVGAPDITLELTSAGTVTPAIRGNADVELDLELTATGFAGRGYDAAITLPMPTEVAAGVTGTVILGAFTLPVLDLSAVIAPQTEIVLPALQLEGTVLDGHTLRSDVSVPLFSLDATITPPATISADITLPRPDMRGALGAGNSVAGTITLPGLSLEGEALVGAVITGDIDLPELVLAAQVHPPATIDASLGLPGLLLRAEAYGDISSLITRRAYSLNTESLGVVPYAGFDYHGLGRMGPDLLGAKADGFYLLEGEDDNGVDIDASFTFGMTDFSDVKGVDPELKKRITDAYVGYRGNGDMLMTMNLDGEGASRVYRLRRRTQDTGLRQRRANLNRGDKSRYWQMELANVSGSDFEIDTIGLLVGATTRKVG